MRHVGEKAPECPEDAPTPKAAAVTAPASANQDGTIGVTELQEPDILPIPADAKTAFDAANQELLFYFVDAKYLRERRPVFQDFKELLRSQVVSPHHLKIQDLVTSQHASEYLVVSHRWITKDHPDPDGDQQRAVMEFLCNPDNKQVKYVWFDYWCAPQGRRSDCYNTYFKYVLRNINWLYLTLQVLILCDSMYVSRFWTCYETWLAMRTFGPRGQLQPYRKGKDQRFVFMAMGALGRAPDNWFRSLHDQWHTASLHVALAILMQPDIQVTNMNDKKSQLDKLKQLPDVVKMAFEAQHDLAAPPVCDLSQFTPQCSRGEVCAVL